MPSYIKSLETWMIGQVPDVIIIHRKSKSWICCYVWNCHPVPYSSPFLAVLSPTVYIYMHIYINPYIIYMTIFSVNHTIVSSADDNFKVFFTGVREKVYLLPHEWPEFDSHTTRYLLTIWCCPLPKKEYYSCSYKCNMVNIMCKY